MLLTVQLVSSVADDEPFGLALMSLVVFHRSGIWAMKHNGIQVMNRKMYIDASDDSHGVIDDSRDFHENADISNRVDDYDGENVSQMSFPTSYVDGNEIDVCDEVNGNGTPDIRRMIRMKTKRSPDDGVDQLVKELDEPAQMLDHVKPYDRVKHFLHVQLVSNSF